MSKLRIVTLGGKEFPLGEFTLDQVSRASILLKQTGKVDTIQEAAARNTVIHIGLVSGGYDGKFDDVLNLKGVKLADLAQAQLEIGRAIGYYADPDEVSQSGEVAGDKAPL